MVLTEINYEDRIRLLIARSKLRMVVDVNGNVNVNDDLIGRWVRMLSYTNQQTLRYRVMSAVADLGLVRLPKEFAAGSGASDLLYAAMQQRSIISCVFDTANLFARHGFKSVVLVPDRSYSWSTSSSLLCPCW